MVGGLLGLAGTHLTSSALNGPVRQQNHQNIRSTSQGTVDKYKPKSWLKSEIKHKPMANKFKMASRFAAAACYPTPGPLFHKETTVYYHETNVRV